MIDFRFTLGAGDSASYGSGLAILIAAFGDSAATVFSLSEASFGFGYVIGESLHLLHRFSTVMTSLYLHRSSFEFAAVQAGRLWTALLSVRNRWHHSHLRQRLRHTQHGDRKPTRGQDGQAYIRLHLKGQSQDKSESYKSVLTYSSKSTRRPLTFPASLHVAPITGQRSVPRKQQLLGGHAGAVCQRGCQCHAGPGASPATDTLRK